MVKEFGGAIIVYMDIGPARLISSIMPKCHWRWSGQVRSDLLSLSLQFQITTSVSASGNITITVRVSFVYF